ncbi:MAG: amidohydrolase family protein [Rhodocyclaceae bacterium]
MTATTLTGRDPASGLPLAVTVERERIVRIEAGPRDETHWLSPGLVDIQVNGYAGHDVNAADVDAASIGALARAVRATGVTTFLPTLITASEDSLLHGLRTIAQARAADPLVARMVPGVHIEGPHLSPQDGPRGAHPREHIRPPDIAEFNRWQAASGGLVHLVTLSPHFDQAPAYTAALTGQGTRVAIGHTDATPEQIRAVVDAGACLSTHLGNGAAAMLPRHPNFIWTQLADPRLSASFIADGFHLPADTFQAMLRAKGIERAILISDTAAVGGLAPGVYDTPIGGRVELTAQGRLGVVDSPYLAGAAKPLAADVASAIRMAGIPLHQALTMATRNPARLLGLHAVLEVGARADLIRFRWQDGDDALQVDEVWPAA